MLNVDMNQLEKAAKNFYTITGMLIVLYDSQRRILYAYPKNMCAFCSEVRKSKRLQKLCFQCDENGFNICDKTKKNFMYHCHMGLTEVISPICENGVIIGYMMFGQILDTNNPEKLKIHTKKMAKEHHLDYKLLENELARMKAADQQTILAAADMMEMCACYLWLKQIISVRKDSLVQHLEEYIEQELSENLSVKSICSHLNVSKSTLYKIAKQRYQMGISEYVLQKRIEKASQLLKEGNLTVSEVADRTGISDANYFIKVFKKMMGVTPKKYITAMFEKERKDV